ncbi:hypothetical protein KRP22_014355 [Phytophthora ramorum]|nr:hypothetical protein KRP22_9043 [Phytophthora ramorum]
MTFGSPLSLEFFSATDLLIPTELILSEASEIKAQPDNRKPARRTKAPKIQHGERQRREKEALNKELARLLQSLKREQARKAEEKGNKQDPARSVWNALARKGLKERLGSEAHQRWLREAVAGKATLIVDLKMVVRQHLKISRLLAAQSQSSLFLEPTDDLLYAMDVHDIDVLYSQTDSVFSSCGLDMGSVETTTFQRTAKIIGDGVSIQFVRRQHMLFSYDCTCQSIWMLSHFVHRQENREDYAGIQDPENTIATKFHVTKCIDGGKQLSLKERIVTRRFKEEKRTVLVWKALLTGEGLCKGMQTEETGWSIIRPSATGFGTTVEVCMRQVPLHLSHLEPVTKQFEEMLQSVIQENSQEITNGAKELLLENMLTGIGA